MSGILSLVAVVSAVVGMASGMTLPGGGNVCDTMIPSGFGGSPQTGSPPYVLLVPTDMIPSGSDINVVVAGDNPNIKFQGFFVEAFDDATGKPLGSFVTAPKTVDCEGEASAAQHGDETEKDVEMLVWRAPVNMKGSVTFRGTVAMAPSLFWNNVQSTKVHLV